MDAHSLQVRKPINLPSPGNSWYSSLFKIVISTFWSQEISTVETKSGPVSHVFLHNVTKFGSIDLIVGDSKGTVTIINNEQIMNRRSLSEGSVSSLTIDRDQGRV